MNVLSLFDGISCGQLALKRAGIMVEKYYSSEIDKHAIKVTQQNFPNTIQLGSVAEITKNDVDKIDILIGGSPCQSFSRSGDGSGFDGKSGLFWEYVRLLKELQPTYFLLENVVMKKEWEKIISNALGVNPVLIDSKLVSAQKRQRLYWTNIKNITQPDDKNIHIFDVLTGEHEHICEHEVIMDKVENSFIVKNATKKGYLIASNGDTINFEHPKSKTRRGRVATAKTNTLNTSPNYAVVKDGNILKLNISEYEQLQNLPVGYTTGISDNKRKHAIGNGWTVDIVAHIFSFINSKKTSKKLVDTN
jgi:DNA (cytosine-5)-methyltransferase 3A